MRRLPPLAALRAFEAAARHMSFKRAAAELAVTPTAISHQMRLLEEILGLRLFERHPRRLLLTAPGQVLYPVLRQGFDAFAKAIGELTAQRPRVVVTLSATPAFVAHWLVPRVAIFNAANPEMDLRLHASVEPVDFREGAVDAAVRYGRRGHPGLEVEELYRDAFAPVCSPHLRLRHPSDLRSQTLIHFEWRLQGQDQLTWRQWLEQAGIHGIAPDGGLTFTDESHAIQAAIAGHGVALLSLVLLADELASGALVQPFGPVLESYSCALLYPKSSANSAKIAAVRGWIRAEMTRSPFLRGMDTGAAVLTHHDDSHQTRTAGADPRP